jgi:glycosyltransferase involved in cell wall biosynthesis
MIRKKAPRISVCLPTYNGAKYLKTAVDSVLSQTFRDLELIICDDRSTDTTQEIAKTFAAQDNRVKFNVNAKRLGLFENYNECLSRAHGEFIKPFAQDDLLDPSILEQMIQAYSSHNGIALVASARKWIDAQGRETKRIVRFPSGTVLAGEEVIMAHLIGLSNWIGEPSAVMFPATLIGDKFDTSFYHYGDIEYWFRILEHGSLLYLGEPLCSFRRHKESSTNANLAGLYFAADIFRLGQKYERYLRDLGETPEHFGKRAVEVIALHLDHLVTKEGVKIQDALAARPRPQSKAVEAELTTFRKALFHSERRITSLLEELIASKNELEHKDGEIKRLWEALNQLTNSVSWKLTKPLRSVRAKMGPSQR